MNIQTFIQIFTRDYSERCPSYLEYSMSAPMDQRAIKQRWREIIHTETPSNFNSTYMAALRGLERALGPVIPIDNKNPCDRDDVEYRSSHETNYGEEYSGITTDDQGV